MVATNVPGDFSVAFLTPLRMLESRPDNSPRFVLGAPQAVISVCGPRVPKGVGKCTFDNFGRDGVDPISLAGSGDSMVAIHKIELVLTIVDYANRRQYLTSSQSLGIRLDYLRL